MNFFGFWEAAPTKKPLIIFISLKFFTFFGFTDPPYKIFGLFNLNFFKRLFFIKLTFFSRSTAFGVIPVPIDHIGSYANNTLDMHNLQYCYAY